VGQFFPVAPASMAAKPMYLFLERIVTQRGVHFDYVRTRLAADHDA
jgi:hypothetical protein